jgi:PhnB protein
MEINAYLSFAGNCEEALAFYTHALGAKVTFMMRYKEAPERHGPPEMSEKIMHASFEIGSTRLMASDSPPDCVSRPAGFCLSIGLKDPDEAAHLFTALAVGGEVQMALQKTFWARAFGMARDKFGIPWMVNCE